MEIVVICPNTIFGVITRIFGSMAEALEFVEVCLNNDLKVEVTQTRTRTLT